MNIMNIEIQESIEINRNQMKSGLHHEFCKTGDITGISSHLLAIDHLLHEGLVEDRREVIFGLVRHPSIEVHRRWGLLRSMSMDPPEQHRAKQRHHTMASHHGSLATPLAPSI